MNKHSIALLAFDNISAFHLSVPCLVFQDAFLGLKQHFNITLCSENSDKVSLSSGFDITIKSNLDIIRDADIIIIPSWPNTLPEPSQNLIDQLTQANQRGALVVGLCLGTYAVAKAGLLDGKRATTHWQFEDQFKLQFPKVSIDCDPLFIDEESVITSAGTAASLDCCLYIVRQWCGREVASQVARNAVTAPFRSGGQQQYIKKPIIKDTNPNTSLNYVLDGVSQTLDQTHTLDSVAASCAMSRRTFSRQFRASFGCSFGTWLLEQRLAYSQELLESTQHSIALIAEVTGFSSEAGFRRHFKTKYQVTPSQWRATFSGHESI
ncbi:MAG: GlxA family transcriptional regulator [Vibrio sp.]